MQFERQPVGRVTLTFIRDGQRSDPIPLPPGSWETITENEVAVFREPEFVPPSRKRSIPPPPPTICHGAQMFFSSTGPEGERVTATASCDGQDVRLEYGSRLARLAISTRPSCQYDERDPLQSYVECFRKPPPNPSDGPRAT